MVVRDNGGVEPASVREDGGAGVADRNTLAALLIDELCEVLSHYDESGFEACAAEWEAADYLHGREISVQTDSGELTGTAMGICPEGRLRVQSNGEEVLLVTGDVSVRTT
jgi:biotin-(acetyl-CoA carboxylase) ligase